MRLKRHIIKKIMRLLSEGLKHAEIAEQCGVSRSIVSKYNTDGPPPSYDGEVCRAYATNDKKLCPKHRAATPCVECAGQAFNERSGRKPNSLPLYGDRKRLPRTQRDRVLATDSELDGSEAFSSLGWGVNRYDDKCG
jgi:hypothetical protein